MKTPLSDSKTSRNGSCYEISGAADGPVIVLIHGLGLNRQVWQKYLSRLGQRYCILTYDLYGHGDSAAPPQTPDLTLFSEQLIGLMDELAIQQCTLVGFSLGGMINRRVAIDHPDRVTALAILNSPHDRGSEAQARAERQALDAAAGGPGATLEAAIQRWFTSEFRASHDDFVERVRGWVLANDPDIYAQCRQVLAAGVVELIRPQPPISHPTLIMTCEHDSGSTPEMSQAIASEIEGAGVIIVPNLKHMGLAENPSFFINALFEFLDAVPLARISH
ncbi:alpha/beta hydrolase [Gammaproteobacteria bacterium]|nr:alpha/beta hydrolase [Gammaproteobacteria bacterium]